MRRWRKESFLEIIRLAVRRQRPKSGVVWAVAAVSDYRVLLGARIRSERRRARLTQEVVAEKADLHPNLLWARRAGRGACFAGVAPPHCQVLGVRVRTWLWIFECGK